MVTGYDHLLFLFGVIFVLTKFKDKFFELVLSKHRGDVIGPMIELGWFVQFIALAAFVCSIVLIYLIMRRQAHRITLLRGKRCLSYLSAFELLCCIIATPRQRDP